MGLGIGISIGSNTPVNVSGGGTDPGTFAPNLFIELAGASRSTVVAPANIVSTISKAAGGNRSLNATGDTTPPGYNTSPKYFNAGDLLIRNAANTIAQTVSLTNEFTLMFLDSTVAGDANAPIWCGGTNPNQCGVYSAGNDIILKTNDGTTFSALAGGWPASPLGTASGDNYMFVIRRSFDSNDNKYHYYLYSNDFQNQVASYIDMGKEDAASAITLTRLGGLWDGANQIVDDGAGSQSVAFVLPSALSESEIRSIASYYGVILL